MIRWDVEVYDEYQAQSMQSNWCLTQEAINSDGIMLAEEKENN